MPSDIPVCFYKTKTGVLLTGSPRGLYTYANKKFYPYPGLPQDISVRNITEDKSGDIWVSTYMHGFFYYNLNTCNVVNYTRLKTTANSIIDIPTVNNIMEDSQGNMWICTESAGLFCLRKGLSVFEHYSTDSGLPSNFVFKTIEDNHGGIWATTSKGLINMDKGRTPFTIYTTADGLLNDQFNYASGFKDATGKLYFGSTQGMIAFYPDRILKNSDVPTLYITNFLSGAKELYKGKDSIFLTYKQSSFNISFAALNYAASPSIRYSYIMDGLNIPWTQLEKNQLISFTDIPPGKYVFKVKAALPGRWETPEKQLIIEISPPFWATKWAYAVYTLFGVLLIYSYIRYIKNREQLKAESKRALELQQYTREILSKNDELKQTFHSLQQSHLENDRLIRIVAHDLRSPMSAIASFTQWMIENKEEASREILPLLNTTATNALVLLDEFLILNTAALNIRKERLNLSTLLLHCINMAKPAAEKKDQVIIFKPSDVFVTGDQEKLWRVFSNLLNNSIKFSAQHKKIYIAMEIDEKQVAVSVRDEGMGIPASFIEKLFNPTQDIKRVGTAGEPSYGLGLNIAYKIVQAHGGKIWVESVQGEGATFYVSFPVLPMTS